MVERGGRAQQREYSSVGPYLLLSGRVHEGSSVTRGFVRQLKELLRRSSRNPPANFALEPTSAQRLIRSLSSRSRGPKRLSWGR